ncbi:MAG: hypothetical protein ABI629_00385 [bacterium]
MLALAYVLAMPRNLFPADESYFLSESKRILGGEALYRDIFWIGGPISQWTMAAIFAIFGVTITVARTTLGVLHGTLVVLLYLSGRRLGVRAVLALAPPLLYFAFCYPVMPCITPHTFSTLAMVAILYALLSPNRLTRPSVVWVPGVYTAALALSHPHQGVTFALATVGLFAAEAAIARHSAEAPPSGAWWPTWQWYALGISVVAVPALLALLATAGPRPLFEQTILMPFTGYREHNQAPWGAVTWPPWAAYTWPPLLRYSPLIMLPACIHLLRGWRQRRTRAELTAAATLVAVGIAAMTSVANLPDIVHVSFVASVFFVAGAAAIDSRCFGLARRHPAARVVVWPLALAILGITTTQMARNHTRMWAQYPYPIDTVFGRVDFEHDGERLMVQRLNAAVAHGSRVAFVYPMWASLYLTTDTINPTAHHLILPRYLSEVEIHRTIAKLAATRPPTVLVVNTIPVEPDDPFVAWIKSNYIVIDPEPQARPAFTIYRLRDDAPPSPAG